MDTRRNQRIPPAIALLIVILACVTAFLAARLISGLTRRSAYDYQSVSISDVEYATLYSDQPLDVPEDVDAYILTGYEGIKLVMERIEHIPAQTGVLLHGAEGTYNFYLGDGRYMNAVSTNLLKGSLESEVIDNLAVHYVLSYDNEHNV